MSSRETRPFMWMSVWFETQARTLDMPCHRSFGLTRHNINTIFSTVHGIRKVSHFSKTPVDFFVWQFCVYDKKVSSLFVTYFRFYQMPWVPVFCVVNFFTHVYFCLFKGWNEPPPPPINTKPKSKPKTTPTAAITQPLMMMTPAPVAEPPGMGGYGAPPPLAATAPPPPPQGYGMPPPVPQQQSYYQPQTSQQESIS